MKNIYLRRNGYYYSVMKNGVRTWINLQTRDYVEAIGKAANLVGNPIVQSSESFKNDLEPFVNYKRDRNQFSAASFSSKKYVLDQFAAWLPEGIRSDQITTNHIQRWYDALIVKGVKKKPVSPSTLDGYIMALRSFFRWAVEVKRLRIDNPALSVQMAEVITIARKNWCNIKLKDRLIRNAPTNELRFILFCGFEAGLRRNEIVEARRDWFDLKQGLLHVRKSDHTRIRAGERPFLIKDRDERTIPLTPEFKEFLGGYLKGLKPLDFALMPNVTHGDWRYRWDFRRPFTDYMSNQKVKWVSPHIMRHSFASILASRGVSIFKVAEWLGDRVDVVQRHYAKLAPRDADICALSSRRDTRLASSGPSSASLGQRQKAGSGSGLRLA